MKKLLTLLMAVMMILTLSACNKKQEPEVPAEEPADEGIHFTLSVEAGGSEEGLEISSAGEENFLKIIEGTIGTNILNCTFENGAVTSINGIDTKDGSKFEVYVNDALYTDSLDKLTVKEGDVIRIVHVPVAVETAPAQENGTPAAAADTLGGWQIHEYFEDRIKKDQKEIFDDAAKDLVGVGYVPLRVLATQIVSGTNYAFLCQGITISGVPEVNYYIIVVYHDLDGTNEVKAINKLDVPNIETKEESSENMLGAWMIIQPEENEKLSEKELQASFEKAAKKWVGLDLIPMQVLASQLVNGTNYMALCYGKTVTEKPVGDLYLVQWYEDLNGNASISSVKNINMAYYVAGE
ncbi:MAG: hypothetical protein IJK53_10560 [Erysipelotrichaceae bacterium]|nr:hypothetical protein [Erysipelotrichaceae bacterium]